MNALQRAIDNQASHKLKVEKWLEAMNQLQETLGNNLPFLPGNQCHPDDPLKEVFKIRPPSQFAFEGMNTNQVFVFVMKDESALDRVREVLSRKLSTEFEEVSRNSISCTYRGTWRNVTILLTFPL